MSKHEGVDADDVVGNTGEGKNKMSVSTTIQGLPKKRISTASGVVPFLIGIGLIAVVAVLWWQFAQLRFPI